jgi:hypothetical protein
MCLSAAIGAMWASAGLSRAQAPKPEECVPPASSSASSYTPRSLTIGTATQVPLDEIPAEQRDKVRKVVEHPTLCTHGTPEAFNCQPALYQWFLDHPDRAALVWRRLGAKCVEMTDRGNGRFGWTDKKGSDVHWDTVYRGPRMRVWHAEGQVRPGPLLPLVPVEAVVVLRFSESRDLDGKPVMRHQADLLVHTDSKTAALAARLLGASAPHMAEQYVAQLQMFFSALPWYLNQHPDRAASLLAGVLPPPSGN